MARCRRRFARGSSFSHACSVVTAKGRPVGLSAGRSKSRSSTSTVSPLATSPYDHRDRRARAMHDHGSDRNQISSAGSACHRKRVGRPWFGARVLGFSDPDRTGIRCQPFGGLVDLFLCTGGADGRGPVWSEAIRTVISVSIPPVLMPACRLRCHDRRTCRYALDGLAGLQPDLWYRQWSGVRLRSATRGAGTPRARRSCDVQLSGRVLDAALLP